MATSKLGTGLLLTLGDARGVLKDIHLNLTRGRILRLDVEGGQIDVAQDYLDVEEHLVADIVMKAHTSLTHA
jgi:hypothetical protein